MTNTLKQLAELIRGINQSGWSPATSTNYSCRDQDDTNKCFVSKSGLDKSLFTERDFMRLDLMGNVDPAYESSKPSAETGIHLMLYQATDANVILHTHSKADTLLSRLFSHESKVIIEGYELLKGLRSISTHEASIDVPIFPNNQDIEALSEQIRSHLNQNPNALGALIESHGFYTWGRTLAEAKRHLEVFQFLFDCELSLALSNTEPSKSAPSQKL